MRSARIAVAGSPSGASERTGGRRTVPPSSTDPLLEFVVGPEAAGQRLDAFLAHALPKYSRVQLRKVIGLAGVKVNGQGTKVAHRLSAGDRISVVLPPMNTAGPHPEEIPLDILYEDEHIIAVNKPPGMVVHPARGHWSGTLASASVVSFSPAQQRGGADAAGNCASPRPRHQRRDGRGQD